jgi:site-specific DNA-cytosine methylase
MCFVVLENVPGLLSPPSNSRGALMGPSNADTACYMLEAEGFTVVMWLLCPRMFGIPQSRLRLYFLVLEKAALQQLGVSECEAEVWLREVMTRLVGSQLQALDSYLLSLGHPAVRAHLADCAALEASTGNPHEALQSSWGVFHQSKLKQMEASRTTQAPICKTYRTWEMLVGLLSFFL